MRCLLSFRNSSSKIRKRHSKTESKLWRGSTIRQEKVEISKKFGKEYAGSYLFQDISWAKRSRIIQKHTKYHPTTGQVMKSDYVAIQAETIWASLKEQPESQPITLDKLLNEEDGIPIGLGEFFSKVVNGLCGVTVEETKNLSGR
jgi:hypothetical protein